MTEIARVEPAQPSGRWLTLALGLVAATIAFWSAAFVFVWLAFAGEELTDGAGVIIGLTVSLLVGMLVPIPLIVAWRRPRLLVGLERGAAVGMVAAMVCVALDRGDLNWSDGTQIGVGFLYGIFGVTALLFAGGAEILSRARPARASTTR